MTEDRRNSQMEWVLGDAGPHLTHISFSDDGETWTEPQEIHPGIALTARYFRLLLPVASAPPFAKE